jgi:hypothetical protein
MGIDCTGGQEIAVVWTMMAAVDGADGTAPVAREAIRVGQRQGRTRTSVGVEAAEAPDARPECTRRSAPSAAGGHRWRWRGL